jgi:hypothetical protein
MYEAAPALDEVREAKSSSPQPTTVGCGQAVLMQISAAMVTA